MKASAEEDKNSLLNCEIIFIRWTFNFIYFVGRTIHQFKIPTNYSFNLLVVCLI